MKYVALTIIIVITAVLTRAEIKLPKYIAPCKAKDDLCLKNLLQKLAPRLKLGIQEFNLPSIDPLDLPDDSLNSSSSSEISYIGYVKNPQYRGASNFQVSKFDIDLEELKFNLVVSFPQLIMRAYEIVWAKAYGIETDGEGFVTEYYDNVTINFSLKGARYACKENKSHVKWTEDLISASMSGGHFDVEPSYTDANYQKLLNKASRDYGDFFYPETSRFVKITLGDFLLKTVNIVHEIFPIDVLYLPDQENLL